MCVCTYIHTCIHIIVTGLKVLILSAKCECILIFHWLLWHCGLQPAKLLCPWDFPDKNTGVAISFSRESSWPRNQTQVSSIAGRFFTNWATQECICNCCSFAKSCPTLCDPMSYRTPGFSVHHYLSEFAQIYTILCIYSNAQIYTIYIFMYM